MRRFAALTALLVLATPSFADHQPDPVALTDAARDELRGLDMMLGDIRDPRLRSDMQARIDRIDSLLADSERALRVDAGRIGFDDAMRLVGQESFDSGKVEVLRSLGRDGRFTTDEARTLASQCQFDSTRADALIALYPSVTDPGRFQLALDILTFASSRREVEEALGL